MVCSFAVNGGGTSLEGSIVPEARRGKATAGTPPDRRAGLGFLPFSRSLQRARRERRCRKCRATGKDRGGRRQVRRSPQGRRTAGGTPRPVMAGDRNRASHLTGDASVWVNGCAAAGPPPPALPGAHAGSLPRAFKLRATVRSGDIRRRRVRRRPAAAPVRRVPLAPHRAREVAVGAGTGANR